MALRPRKSPGVPSGRSRSTKKKSADRSPETPPATNDAAGERDQPGRGALFPIVGIGASAGGLEAFMQLLGALPLDTGMGFVLVQHLDPDHESALTQILSRATSLHVSEITNDEPVQANHVYVIPRDTTLSIAAGVLKIQPRKRTPAPHRPIDSFFESLARDQRERAVGVVLSGTATDGTLGLEAIKAEGGITFAQDDSAKHDSMPRSAVAAGCVDLILSPADIAKQLARIAKHPYVVGQSLLTTAEGDEASATTHKDGQTPPPPGGRGSSPAQNGYQKILLLLRNHSNVDFSLYKSTTIRRRITRRLVLNRQDTLEDYAGFLRGNAKELDALYSDVLISVTSFFRNPETYDVLERKVLPEILKQRGDDPLRFWVLGCSTGQEAYSLAIAFMEAAEKAPRMRKLQIFATDLNDALLDKARHGLYAKSLAEEMTPQRLRRFFVEEQGGYRVIKPLREMVVFARQNLIADPPFSRMDLISCRNMLIYLEPSVQKKAMPTFHFALKPRGFLLLGASESIGGFTDLFEPVDKRHKIYSRKSAPTQALHLPLGKLRGEQRLVPRLFGPMQQPGGPELLEGSHGEVNAQREADRITVAQFAPPAVLVNADLQVLQFRGPTGAFLEPPIGKASFDVLKMAREGLMLPLRSAINQAKRAKKTVRKENVRLHRNGKTRTVNLEVIPLKNLRERCFLILFEEAKEASGGREPPGPQPAPKGRSSSGEKTNRIAELETELSETREYLQAMQEQHEAANEELQAASEEAQSANEELQSVNEELETSKEELESANEELTTVNEEMTNRNVELNSLNSDLVNLQSSANLAIVLLGRDLTIRRFGPKAEKQFDLRVADLGRPIGHVRHHLVLGDATGTPLDLEGLIAEVIAGEREQGREVRDKGGRWYSLRVRPYLTLDNQVDGAVMVLVDIDTLKRSEHAVRESEARYRAIFESTNVGVSETDLETGRLLRVNDQFARIAGYTAAELIGKTFLELTHPDDLPGSWEGYSRLSRGEIAVSEIEKRLVRKDGTIVWTHATVNLVADAAGRPLCTVAITLDITERKRADEALSESHAQLRVHAEELTRFNRVAIGRESRMIELKREVDEVCRRHGEAARYPFKSEQDVGIQKRELEEQHQSPTAVPRDGPVPLESVLRTEDLNRRPFRPPDYQTENRALAAMAQALAESPRTILQTLAELIRDAFKADSAGISLLTKDEKSFHWPAIAGVWQPHIGGGTPRDFGPCGDVLDRNGPLLFTHFERRYPYLLAATPPVEECLLVPFYVEGKAVGTIWAIAHDDRRKFDAEDLRQLESLGRFASAAYQAVELRQVQDSRLAALNLLEDAVEARQSMEMLNAEVRESEKRYRALFESIDEGFCVIETVEGKAGESLDFRYVEANPAFATQSGVTGVVGKTIRQMVPGEAEEWLLTYDAVRRTGEPIRFERGLVTQGRVLELYAFRIEDETNRRVAVIFKDITERKRLENELRQYGTDLAEADRRKNEFLAMLGHELRNPLTAIAHGLDLLGKVSDDRPRSEELRGLLVRQTKRIGILLDQLLDIARVISGKVNLSKDPVDLADVVRAAVETVRPLVENQKHKLTLSLPADKSALVLGDAVRLSQVVENLLTNAAKYTNEGGQIALTLETDKDKARIIVRDSGVGMSARFLPHVFEVFTQAPRTLDRAKGGLGLGLPLVRRLVEMHDGQVNASSPGLGQGSKFIITLPLLLEMRSDKSLGGGTVPMEPGKIRPRRILVVDDEEDVATTFADLLEKDGHQTLAVNDGPAALAAFGKFGPEVVLIDLGLPGMDGYEVARRLREEHGDKKILLVAVTGYQSDAARLKQAGFDQHLLKPPDMRKLSALFANWNAT